MDWDSLGWVRLLGFRVSTFLGPPVVPFSPLFRGEGSPTKIDDRKKSGTLILTSLLEDLVEFGRITLGTVLVGCHLPLIVSCLLDVLAQFWGGAVTARKHTLRQAACASLQAAGPPQRAAYFGTEYWRAEKEEVRSRTIPLHTQICMGQWLP